jgi:ribonuclease P protein component
LCHDLEFQAVHAGKMRKQGRFLMLWAIPNGRPSWRLGLAVSSRAGHAAVRVRCKRLIREAFRQAQHDLPLLEAQGFDAIVGVRDARGICFATVDAELRQLASQAADEWARRRRRSEKETP